ncbi:hypothetical protein C8J57DRAFT_1512021 [Mycena rebaudengoi]|nr:hypothetical protein C8J57DRAFT_1512021 [Mycena rebaudengoi]
MPFTQAQADTIEKQVLHATISAHIPFIAWENPEVKKLFHMIHPMVVGVFPSRKVDSAPTDGSRAKKADVSVVCANVEYKTYTLKLIDMTAQNKDRPSLCKLFGSIIDHVEEKYDCWAFYFTTDADGGNKTGRVLLGSSGRGYWFQHAEEYLQFAVLQSRGAILAAQVGAAKSTVRDTLAEEANLYCDLILDPKFWSGLTSVVEDIEPICYGTNITQKDSTRADQVLLTLAGLKLHCAAHPVPEISRDLVKQLEKRWADCDQLLFLVALILNPFEGLSCFGP